MDMSLEELSQASGIRLGRLEDIETENSTCATVYEALKIADSLGTLVSDLLGETSFVVHGAEEGHRGVSIVAQKPLEVMGHEEIDGDGIPLEAAGGDFFMSAPIVFSCAGWLPPNVSLVDLKALPKKILSEIPLDSDPKDYRQVNVIVQEYISEVEPS